MLELNEKGIKASVDSKLDDSCICDQSYTQKLLFPKLDPSSRKFPGKSRYLLCKVPSFEPAPAGCLVGKTSCNWSGKTGRMLFIQ